MKTFVAGILLVLVCLAPALAPAQASHQMEDWATPAEKSSYRTTPRYDETMACLKRMAAANPKQLKLEVFGKTPEGRDLWIAIASKDGNFDPASLHKQNRPIVLVQNAIHAGEMDGKDSSLALLRDMVITKTRAQLLDRAIVVVIPIYNLDGHERFGAYNRINQNGPEQMGWRTTAQNLNLNRDYLKADAPETRAWLTLWNRWLPDFFFDNHVTDGADYQFDTTYDIATSPDVDPGIAEWVKTALVPDMEKSVNQSGHLISPYIEFADEADPMKGLATNQVVPRFSHGYTILQNRPGMLVEIHMLKDYRTRVTGNYELMRAVLEVINRDAERLVRLNREADQKTIRQGQQYNPNTKFPLILSASNETIPFHYLGYKFNRSLSDISGAVRIEYTKEPLNIDIPHTKELVVQRAVVPPLAYIVPPQWTRVIDVLQAHGLELKRTTAAWTGEVETYRCPPPKWPAQPFEGRHPAPFGDQRDSLVTGATSSGSQASCKLGRERRTFPAGSVIVPLNQRAAKVAIHFLEPEGPDSAVLWNFFDAIFEQKEYGESYVLEKLARDMMAKDPELKKEFENKVATDPQFAANPYARLNFFYQRSPYWDKALGLYPVGRLTSLEGVPLGSQK
jgi:hypothetical protein